uniref:BEN domain-containing protein n=1 Tax=Amblyomma parvum TaxID=251391 RepID=A0A023FXE4_AMBPA
MPTEIWAYIMKNTSDARCCFELTRHLWTPSEPAERSFTGQQCRSVASAGRNLPATPEKVEVVKNCLAKFVDEYSALEALRDCRVDAVRKHVRSVFTEAGRQGKRVWDAVAQKQPDQ